MNFYSVQWQDNSVVMLDQRKLPHEEIYHHFNQVEEVAQAIKDMVIRGAPAIGVAAAFGMALTAQNSQAGSHEEFIHEMNGAAQLLISQRPTAVNLAWAVQRILDFIQKHRALSLLSLQNHILEEALSIYEEDCNMCLDMGVHGAKLIELGKSYLTYCNTGALATAGRGTALAVFYEAAYQRKKFKVFACETRPFLQGARLTCWELLKNNIDTTLITDNMVAYLMRTGKIHGVFVGSDRIVANGDVANKIGTYGVALAAQAHNVPFYVVAPSSTIDLATENGSLISIEERDPAEITSFFGTASAPENVKVCNPAFDITPHELVTAIITEKGIIKAPYREQLKKLFET